MRKILDADTIDARQKMWQLSWICFSDDQERPRNLDGKWDDLPSPLQSQILDTCENAFDTCDPTPIPESSSFSSTILYEAWCFRKLVADRQQSFLLNESRIREVASFDVYRIDAWQGRNSRSMLSQ